MSTTTTPRDAGRHVCSASDPWSPEKTERATHPDAVYVGSRDRWPGGDIDIYDCPHCGLRFKVEAPQ